MWVRIRENARVFRALAAVAAVMALVAVMIQNERAITENREMALSATHRSLWAVSELVFESQRLVAAISEYKRGVVSKQDLQIRFEILWSRLSSSTWLDNLASDDFKGIFLDFDAYMYRVEPVFFDRDALSVTELEAVARDLNKMTLDTRRIWIGTFGNGNTTANFVDTRDGDKSVRWYQILAMALIAMLVVYIAVEFILAARAQRRESELHAAAAAASASKSRFLANVSHEIRTPLNGILGMASELSETRLSEDQVHCLRVIEQSGSVLLSTINDVLDLSKIEAGKFEIEMRPFILRDILEAACGLYSGSAREKGLKLTCEVKENLPRVVMGDERRLRQVLHNLIANAVKFTETGSITVRASPEKTGANIVFSVKDTGPGIPPEARERIFQPFMQADSGIDRQYGGTGLGLAISRQLCLSMGGSLTLFSRPGDGTTFFCSLPLSGVLDREKPVQAVEQRPPPDLTGWSLLIVDDNATNRVVLDRFLKPTNARTTMADSGAMAIELLAETRFDIVFMDIQMPRMDGIAATRAIRALEAERRLPPVTIVAVTANVLSHQVGQYRDAGMKDVLAKPVNKALLMALLHKHAEQLAAA